MALTYKFMSKKMAIVIVPLGLILLFILWQTSRAVYIEHLLKGADRVEYSIIGAPSVVITDKKELSILFRKLSLSPCTLPHQDLLGGGIAQFQVKGRIITSYFLGDKFEVLHGDKGRKSWVFCEPVEFHKSLEAQVKHSTHTPK